MKTFLTILAAALLVSTGALLTAGCWADAFTTACGALTCWMVNGWTREDEAEERAEAARLAE